MTDKSEAVNAPSEVPPAFTDAEYKVLRESSAAMMLAAHKLTEAIERGTGLAEMMAHLAEIVNKAWATHERARPIEMPLGASPVVSDEARERARRSVEDFLVEDNREHRSWHFGEIAKICVDLVLTALKGEPQ